MAEPAEVLRIPSLRGLHDFPEKAHVGHAAEALNVEFVDGGVSRRRGAAHVRNIAVGPGPNIAGKGIWSWRDVAGATWHIVAYVDYALPGRQGKAYIQIGPPGGAPVVTFDLSARLSGGVTWHWPAGTVVWTGTAFQPAGQIPALNRSCFVIATEFPQASVEVVGDACALWAIFGSKGGEGGFQCQPIGPLRRDATGARYWGGAEFGIPSLAEADDAPAYYGSPDSTGPDFQKGLDRDQVGGRLVTTYRGRLVTSGRVVFGDPHMIQWSNLGDIKPDVDARNRNGDLLPGVVQGWPIHNFVQLIDADQSPITAMNVWKDFLVVWKERSVRLLRFRGIQDFTMLQESFGIGHVAKGAPIQVRFRGHDHIFFVADDGFYSWNGTPTYISGPIERRLRTRGHLRNCIGFAHPTAGQVWWLVGRGVAASARWFVYDLDTGYWSEMEYGGDFDAAALMDEGSGKKPWPHVIGADRSGVHSLNIARIDKGGADFTHNHAGAGQNYDSRWESQRLAFGRHQVRSWRHLRIDQEQAEGADDITVWWALDNQNRGTQVAAGGQNVAMSTQPGAPGTFGTLVFGNALFQAGEGQFFHSRVDLFADGPGRWFRWGVERNGINVPRWHLTSAEVDTRRLVGRR